MIVTYPWRTSMFRWWYELLVPSMNVPAHPAQPMLLVFLASRRPCQPGWCTLCDGPSVFWDCADQPPKSMQKALLDQLTSTQNALPPDFEGELLFFANGR